VPSSLVLILSKTVIQHWIWPERSQWQMLMLVLIEKLLLI